MLIIFAIALKLNHKYDKQAFFDDRLLDINKLWFFEVKVFQKVPTTSEVTLVVSYCCESLASDWNLVKANTRKSVLFNWQTSSAHLLKKCDFTSTCALYYAYATAAKTNDKRCSVPNSVFWKFISNNFSQAAFPSRILRCFSSINNTHTINCEVGTLFSNSKIESSAPRIRRILRASPAADNGAAGDCRPCGRSLARASSHDKRKRASTRSAPPTAAEAGRAAPSVALKKAKLWTFPRHQHKDTRAALPHFQLAISVGCSWLYKIMTRCEIVDGVA